MKASKSELLDLHASMHECMRVVLDHAATAPFTVLTEKLAGFGLPTVREQITHVFSAETAWVSALRMLPQLRRFDPDTLSSVEDLRRAQREAISFTLDYLSSTTEDELNSLLPRYHEEWTSPHRTPGFILMHVITHAFHHKGQIVAMLRLLGYPAPDTDMQRH